MIDLNYKPHYTPGPDFARSENNPLMSAAMANGKRYESKSLLEIGGRCAVKGWKAESAPWIKYKKLDGSLRYCQPDVIITLNALEVIVVEIKLKHTRRAFEQLDLYKTCLEAMKPGLKVSAIIWCKYFDPGEGVVTLIDDLEYLPLETTAIVWKK